MNSNDFDHTNKVTNAIVVAVCFVAFWGLFACSWIFSAKRFPHFTQEFTPAQRADWCSRINSTIHAVVIVCGVIYAVSIIDWDKDYIPKSSIQPASTIFSIAIGYFLCDLMIVIYWPIPMQFVFVIHHIVAVVPYVINNFVQICDGCQFGLLLFLLVEIATLPLNARGFLDSLGKNESISYSRAVYVTYILWAISRTLLPIYLIYIFWMYAYPADKANGVCIYPNIICAHIIAAFCIGVFVFVHTPELYQRHRKRQTRKANSNGILANDFEQTIPNNDILLRKDSSSQSKHYNTPYHHSNSGSV